MISFRSVNSEGQWDFHVDMHMHSWKLMSGFRIEIRARDWDLRFSIEIVAKLRHMGKRSRETEE